MCITVLVELSILIFKGIVSPSLSSRASYCTQTDQSVTQEYRGSSEEKTKVY